MCGICGENWDTCNCDDETFAAYDEYINEPNDDVDETNYDPYSGCDVFETYDDSYGGDW